MKKSNFQFSNPHLVELHYHENSDFKIDAPNSVLDVPISIESNENVLVLPLSPMYPSISKLVLNQKICRFMYQW